MDNQEPILIFLMALGAFFMPFLSKRLYLPAAVGEIIYGIIIASLIPNTGTDFEILGYLSSLGFLILMYLAGLELDFEHIKTLPKKEIYLYLMIFLIIGILSYYITSYLNYNIAFALIFFTTGLGLLFPVLKEVDLLKKDFGKKLLIITMLGEVLTLLGLTAITITTKHGMTVESAKYLLFILIFFLAIYIFLRILKVILWWKPNLQSLFLEAGNSTETGLRTNFVILFAFVALASVFNIEYVVGAFVGGMIVALVFSNREPVLQKLGAVGYGFFIPIFFISVGMKVTYKDFINKDVIILSLIIIGVIFLTRIVGSLVLFFSDIPKKNLILVSTGLSFPLTMLVAVSSVSYQAKLIDKTETSAILLASMMSAIIFPWIFKAIYGILSPDQDV